MLTGQTRQTLDLGDRTLWRSITTNNLYASIGMKIPVLRLPADERKINPDYPGMMIIGVCATGVI